MTALGSAVRSYLTPPIGAFWKWSDDGEALVWADNRTIAFRGELETVLRRQMSQGLPPLGPIVLLLAACRDSWSDFTESKASAFATENAGYESRWPFAPLRFSEGEVRAMMQGLDHVRALPAELRQSITVKAELAATVFETNRQRGLALLAQDIVDAIADGGDSQAVGLGRFAGEHRVGRHVSTPPACRRIEPNRC